MSKTEIQKIISSIENLVNQHNIEADKLDYILKYFLGMHIDLDNLKNNLLAKCELSSKDIFKCIFIKLYNKDTTETIYLIDYQNVSDDKIHLTDQCCCLKIQYQDSDNRIVISDSYYLVQNNNELDTLSYNELLFEDLQNLTPYINRLNALLSYIKEIFENNDKENYFCIRFKLNKNTLKVIHDIKYYVTDEDIIKIHSEKLKNFAYDLFFSLKN